MAEKKLSEEIKELEPEILKYIGRESFNKYLDDVKDIEETYSKRVAECEKRLIINNGIIIASHILNLAKDIRDACMSNAITGDDIGKCFSEWRKITAVAWSGVRKMIKDLEKCGCKIE
jgi:cation transport regulator ChaB